MKVDGDPPTPNFGGEKCHDKPTSMGVAGLDPFQALLFSTSIHTHAISSWNIYHLHPKKKKNLFKLWALNRGGTVPFGEGLFMKCPWFSLVCLEITHNKPVSTPRTTTTSAELSSFPTPRPGLKHYPRQKGLNPFLKWKGLSEQTTICSENILVFGRVTYKKFSNHQSHWNKTIHRPHRTIQQSIRSWQKRVN